MPREEFNRLIRAVRREDAEAAISLRKRRRWYDNEGGAASGTQQDDANPDQESGGAEQQLPPEIAKLIDEIKADPASFAKHVKDLRAEAAARRKALKDAEDQRLREETERLANEKKFEELAGKLKGQLDQIQPKAARAEALETYLQESVQKRIEALPQQYRTMVPQYEDPLKTLQWLDANAAVLTAQRAPGLDGGAQGDGKGQMKLTPEEIAIAQKLGLTPEQYAKYK